MENMDRNILIELLPLIFVESIVDHFNLLLASEFELLLDWNRIVFNG